MPYKIEFKKDHTNSKGETAESSIRARLAGEHGGFKNKS